MTLNIIEAPLSGPQVQRAAWQELSRHAEDNRPFLQQAVDLGLNWKINEEPVQVGGAGAAASWKGLVRSDTGDILNITKKRYTPVQPDHILAFFDSLREREQLTMETVGVLGGGRIIWGLASTGRDLSFTEEDKVLEYILAASSADYSFSTVVKRTSIRVVCRNTLEMALRTGNEGQGFLKRNHAGAFDFELAREKIVAIKADEEGLVEFKQDAQRLAQTKVSEDDAVKFFVKTLFPGKKVQEVKDSKRAAGRLEEVIAAYHSAPGQELDTARGTAWGLLNTITYLTDHVVGKTPDARVKSSFFAEGAILKQKALQVALKLAA